MFFHSFSYQRRPGLTEVEWLDIFAGNLISLMRDARMTQRELADVSGVSEATISKYVNKQQMPNVKAVVNIAYALNVDLEELVPADEMII